MPPQKRVIITDTDAGPSAPNEERAEEQIEIRGPGGLGFNFRGTNTLLLIVLLFVVIAGTILYAMYTHESAAKERQIDWLRQTQDTKEVVSKLTQAVIAQEKTQEAMIYVLTLPQDARERLNLTRPERLRQMQQ